MPDLSSPLVKPLNRRAALKLAGLGLAATIAAPRRGHAADTDVPPTPLVAEFVYEAMVTITPAVEVGPGARGTRRYVPITGGTFRGPRLEGVVLPGGADWQLDRTDGVTEIDALYSMKCDDGTVIIVHNRGLAAAGWSYVRTTPQFEAPRGPYEWLNQSIFVGSIAGAARPDAVLIRVFRVV